MTASGPPSLQIQDALSGGEAGAEGAFHEAGVAVTVFTGEYQTAVVGAKQREYPSEFPGGERGVGAEGVLVVGPVGHNSGAGETD